MPRPPILVSLPVMKYCNNKRRSFIGGHDECTSHNVTILYSISRMHECHTFSVFSYIGGRLRRREEEEAAPPLISLLCIPVILDWKFDFVLTLLEGPFQMFDTLFHLPKT